MPCICGTRITTPALMDTFVPRPPPQVELGPGRGTLLTDALRSTAAAPRMRHALPGFAPALELHLVETSPALRRLQVAGSGCGGRVWGWVRLDQE
jgi:NADH dehydrogenase [ubiquinone] 1 alpha subcomplex assembly factor 7